MEKDKIERIEFSPAFIAALRWVTVTVDGKERIYSLYYSPADAEYHVIDDGTISGDLAAQIISKLRRKISHEGKNR